MTSVSQDLYQTATLRWPAGLPDLLRIEYLWDQLEHQLREPMNVQDLQVLLQHLWANVLQEAIWNVGWKSHLTTSPDLNNLEWLTVWLLLTPQSVIINTASSHGIFS